MRARTCMGSSTRSLPEVMLRELDEAAVEERDAFGGVRYAAREGFGSTRFVGRTVLEGERDRIARESTFSRAKTGKMPGCEREKRRKALWLSEASSRMRRRFVRRS